MPLPRTNLIVALALLLTTSSAVAQQAPVGTPVDRNVADTGANSASQRLVQPGIGQFGVGSLLLDRYDKKPHSWNRANPIVGDIRTSHRYLMQAPGITALMKRPDYIGLSPEGKWVFNRQTYDGAEILTYSPDTVFVLSPQLLTPQKHNDQINAAWENNPYRVRPITVDKHHAIRRNALITDQPHQITIERHPLLRDNPNYVHPEIIERRKRWKAEREAEKKAQDGKPKKLPKQQAEAKAE